MSMAQAVDHVARVNQWRKDNMRQLNLEETLKADLHKEYPARGTRWVQLNRKGQFDAESDAMGHSVRGYEPTPDGGGKAYGIDRKGWEAILSGRAKVYSLRDSKGQPKSTFEVKTEGPYIDINTSTGRTAAFEEMPESAQKKYAQQFDDEFGAGVSEDEGFGAWLQKEAPEYYAEITAPQPSSLMQMKGPNNRPVDKEFWNEAQDFVRSTDWGSVNTTDLPNIGLYPLDTGPNINKSVEQYARDNADFYPTLTLDELESIAENIRGYVGPKFDPNRPKYVNEEELAALFNKYAPTVVSKAKGGIITKKAKGGNVERVYNDRKYI
jgi:single-stranded DNA-binding protein